MEWPSVKYYSLLWGLIITVVQIHGHGGCFEEERMGLLQFKEFVRTSGADADRLLPSWVDHASQSDCCGWERVTCNSTTGHVIELSLHNIKQLYNYTYNYEGEIFHYWDDKIWLLNVSIFRAFKELRSLNLSLNEIGGWIENEGFESLSRSKMLETLDLGFNKLNMSTMQSLSAITSLKNLILNDNDMKGSFPAKELSALENLEMLNLSCNRLNGSLSQDSKSLSKLGKLKQLNLRQNLFGKEILRYLGALPVLNSLDLSHNRMSGLLGNADLADMRSLKVLNLQHNFLHGVLPIEGFAASGSLEILDLSRNIFKTIIPRSIGRLTSLKALSLSQNYFYGSLPSEGLCKLEKLEEFDVSMNDLEGTLPSCINFNLTSLRLLDLSNNKFSGNISSSWIASLTSLQYIDISYNHFEGLFSFSSFANHSQLEAVQFICDDSKLQITEISGWIPLFQLQVLVLSNCLKNLSSEIPAFLFHQHNLRVADLSHNKLKGRFPGWLLENNTRLVYLSLTDNSFFGPFHLPLHLYNLSISWMDVSVNQFDGQLQENIGNLLPNIKSLNLSRNAFEGRLPSSIGNMSGMKKFDVSFNNFSGVVPKELVADCSNLEVLQLSRNNFHGDLFSTQFNLTQLVVLDFNGNQFSGTLSKKLLIFAPDLLDGSNNSLSGKIPSWICNETWIHTLILSYNLFRGHFQCENSELEFLDLSHNFLSGSLPSWSGLEALKHIHFQGNMFSGSIPKGFINAISNGSKIETLDISENNLSGSIPSILGAVSNLRVLLLNGNSFGGVIPTQLCRLVQVSIMSLSNNYFSGSIPNCFHYIAFGSGTSYDSNDTGGIELVGTRSSLPVKNFKISVRGHSIQEDEVQFVTKHRTSTFTGRPLYFMGGLDLSGNNLTGPIPHELGMLASIHALNLSRNQLTGSIPKTFSNLTQIESLDLSHNKLSGKIPSELTGLHFLEVFTVAYNNLSGRIPDMKQQFSTFDETSYEENPLLCGPPLKKNCTNVDEPPPSATKSYGKWYEIDHVVFFASFFVTYFMFFLGVVAFLYVNPYLQRRWFNLIEDSVYSCYYFVVDTLRRLSDRFV